MHICPYCIYIYARIFAYTSTQYHEMIVMQREYNSMNVYTFIYTRPCNPRACMEYLCNGCIWDISPMIFDLSHTVPPMLLLGLGITYEV